MSLGRYSHLCGGFLLALSHRGSDVLEGRAPLWLADLQRSSQLSCVGYLILLVLLNLGQLLGIFSLHLEVEIAYWMPHDVEDLFLAL